MLSSSWACRAPAFFQTSVLASPTCHRTHLTPPLCLTAPLANTRTKIIAPATTVLFIPRDPPPSLSATLMPSNIPQGQIYADIIIPSTIVVMSQPRGASTATMGGLMAARMNKLGAQGVLVDGRVRDVAQLTDSRFVHMPVWSRGVSAVATRGECKAHAVGMEVWVGKSRVRQVYIDYLLLLCSYWAVR